MSHFMLRPNMVRQRDLEVLSHIAPCSSSVHC